VSASLRMDQKPKLAPKAKLRLDPKTGKYVLLYPEKGLLLNATGAAILKRCTGELTLSEIVDELAHEFPGESDALGSDVLAFVHGLLERGLVQAES